MNETDNQADNSSADAGAADMQLGSIKTTPADDMAVLRAKIGELTARVVKLETLTERMVGGFELIGEAVARLTEHVHGASAVKLPKLFGGE